MKNIFIIRGVPGSGKTTFARTICDTVLSADDYFTDTDGNYNFNPKYLKKAHEECQWRTEQCMKGGIDIAVANTFTQEWEMQPYLDMAEKYGYRVFSIIVENRHGKKSVHDVPDDAIDRMKNRFQISL